MKIAIDVSPLQTGHRVRGVGFYLEYLKRSLTESFPKNTYQFFKQGEKVESDVDLVHYPYFDPFFITLPTIKKHKTVVTVHDLTPIVFPNHFPAGIKGKARWYMQRLNLKKADAIITDSIASKKDVERIIGLPDYAVNAVYLAAAEEFKQLKDKKHREEIIQKYKLPEKFVLYVGDATWNKNLPNLIRAIQEINLTLVMVGKTLSDKHIDVVNPWNKDLVEVQNLAKNDKRIVRLGFIPTEDVVALYNAATIFAMPSHYEGFGLPIIEAMQCGCPVVTSKGGSLSEVAGDAAYFVDSKDIHSIANGIGEVYYNTKIQQELSHKGIIQAKNFSWEKTAEQTIRVYKKVLSS